MAETVRLATRGSNLAMAQARIVAGRIRRASTGVGVELVEVATTGDIDRTSPVAELTEIGAFVRSVQLAVLDGRADAAVHSCKDLPTNGRDELQMIIAERADPSDVLVGGRLDALPSGARVGTGSPRRAAQLLMLRPDLEVAEIRGNVDTRLQKVADGEYAAAVLAAAGLERIGRASAVVERFSLEEMVPAPAQGALAIEFHRSGEHRDLLASLEEPNAARAVAAERELLSQTGAGCRSALGAFAEADGPGLRMAAFVSDEHGPRMTTCSGDSPQAVAAEVRRELNL